MCICVSLCVYFSECVYMSVCVSLCACMCVSVNAHVCHVCLYVCMYVHSFVFMWCMCLVCVHLNSWNMCSPCHCGG